MEKEINNADDIWITTKTGSKILIDGEGNVKGGAGGALDGKKLDKAKSVDFSHGKYTEKSSNAKIDKLKSDLQFSEKTLKDIKAQGRDFPFLEKEISDLKESIKEEESKSEKSKNIAFPNKIVKKSGNFSGSAEKIADSIEKASNGAFEARVESSRVSESTYLSISTEDGTDSVKIRISEHQDKYGGNDLSILPSETKELYDFIGKFLKKNGAVNFDKMIPSLEKKNAKEYAGRFFCKHMKSGIAGGYDGDQKLFINEDGIKSLSPTFEGKPVYVGHQQVTLSKLQEEADGYVVKSFYNEKDGWWWAEFMAVSDKAHDAIRQGCGVSNAYVPTEYAEGDQHIGVDYDARVLNGYFTHLAIVPNPRYEESIILTPDQFKEYQDKKTAELRNISNSKTTKGVNIMSLFGKIFKTETVEVTNALPADADYSKYSVDVDGKMLKLSEIINAVKNMDKEEEKEKEEKLNENTIISYDGKDTTFGELMNRFKKGMKNSDDEDEDDIENGDDSDEDEDEEKEKKNKKSKKNSESDEEDEKDEKDEKKNSREIKNDNFRKLVNAGNDFSGSKLPPMETTAMKLQRGQDLYK